MISRTNYLLAVGIIALLTWTAATDLAARLVTAPHAGSLPLLAPLTAGSETLAIIVLAALIAALPALVLMAARGVVRLLGRGTYREVRNFATAWERFSALYGLAPSWRPRHAWRDPDPAMPAEIVGRDLYLAWYIADAFCAERARNPAEHDFADFVVLHELAHARSGDAHLSRLRDNLAVTCAALIGVSYALISASVFNPLFLAEVLLITLLGAALVLALLRQVSREIEAAADSWAFEKIVSVHGRPAGEAILQKLRSGQTIGTPETAAPLSLHPSLRRRVALLQSGARVWPLVMLWATAVAVLAWIQQQRIDAPCNDCGDLYQAWFDLAGLVMVGLITALCVSFARQRRRRGQATRYGAGAALLAVAGAFIAIRWWLSAETVTGLLVREGLGTALRWTFLSSDLYTWLVSLHLFVMAVVLLWPVRRQRVDHSALLHADAPGRTWPTLDVTAVRNEIFAISESFGRGISLSLIVAGLLTIAGPMLHRAADPSAVHHWLSDLLGLGIALLGAAGYWASWPDAAPSQMRPFGSGALLRRIAGQLIALGVEALGVGALLLILAFLHRLQLAYMEISGLDPASPEVQFGVGARMLQNPLLFWREPLLARAWPGMLPDGSIIGAGLLALFSLRLWSRCVARKAN